MSEKQLDSRIPADHVAMTDGITELRRQEALLISVHVGRNAGVCRKRDQSVQLKQAE